MYVIFGSDISWKKIKRMLYTQESVLNYTGYIIGNGKCAIRCGSPTKNSGKKCKNNRHTEIDLFAPLPRLPVQIRASARTRIRALICIRKAVPGPRPRRILHGRNLPRDDAISAALISDLSNSR